MTNELATSQAAATNLVAAGEALYKSITGAEMSANQQKIADGITHIVDGLVPGLEAKVSLILKTSWPEQRPRLTALRASLSRQRPVRLTITPIRRPHEQRHRRHGHARDHRGRPGALVWYANRAGAMRQKCQRQTNVQMQI